MQIFTIIAVCITILTVFGVLDCMLEKLGLTRFELVFVCFGYVLLSAFEVAFSVEVSVNMAMVFLPSYFLLLHISKQESSNQSYIGFLVVITVLIAHVQKNYGEYFGIIMSGACILSAFLFKETPVFALFAVSCMPVFSCVFFALFEYMQSAYAAFELVGNNLLNIQLASTVLSAFVMNFVIEKRSVIKA